MKTTRIAFVLLLAAGVLAGTGAVSAQDAAYFKKHIYNLASKKFAGRGYTNDKDGQAASYIAKEFQKNGALPVSELNADSARAAGVTGYFQPFRISHSYYPGKMKVSVDGKTLRPGLDFIPTMFSDNVKGTYDLYYFEPAGKDASEAMKQLKEQGKGKIIVADYLPASMLLGQLMNPESALAPAGIIARMDMEQLAKMGGMPAYAARMSPLTMSQSGRKFPLDMPFLTVPAGLLNGEKSISIEIDAGFIENDETSNVIACIPGNGPHADSLTVVMAHYDHIGQLGKKTYYPGALDNASGVSMLLALSNYFGRPENRPAHTLVFVATSAEELGLLGSDYFVKHAPIDLSKIRYAINLDMVADRTSELYTAVSGNAERGYGLFREIVREEQLNLNLQKEKPIQNSDHWNFIRKGIPTVMFSMFEGDVFPNIHTPSDLPENACYDHYDDLFRLITQFIRTY